MLGLRIVTALVLLPIVVGAVFFLERTGFAWVAAAFFVAAGWEWTGLMKLPGPVLRLGWCALLGAVMAAVHYLDAGWVVLLAPLWWLVALGLVVVYPAGTRHWRGPGVLALTGLLVLVPAWLAIVRIQQAGAFGLAGPWALMFVLLWVWAADTGAYAAGRACGRHRLAPAVSPGKTLEGLAGGVALALLVVLAVSLVHGSMARGVPLLLVAAVTVLASVLGDLFESMLKREAGVKDSGRMLPGHGGMLDRIDSVTAALPVALAAAVWTGLADGP